jgi:hypothetical protein
MSQAREVVCLDKQQIKATIEHLCESMNLETPKEIFSGKPSYTKELEQKYNLKHITKFASNYYVYESHGKDDDGEDYAMYFITLEAQAVDKQNILACEWFYHLFDSNISPDGVMIHGRRVPQVYICPAYVISDTLFAQCPTNIFPCLYRIATLTEMYPNIGSNTARFGMVYDYVINNSRDKHLLKDFSILNDGDVLVKILNAVPGDVIDAIRVMNEVSAYQEPTSRVVVSNETDIGYMRMSGLCDGRVDMGLRDEL